MYLYVAQLIPCVLLITSSFDIYRQRCISIPGKIFASQTFSSQTESKPVDKYYFTWTTKGDRCYSKFKLQRAFIEGPYNMN